MSLPVLAVIDVVPDCPEPDPSVVTAARRAAALVGSSAMTMHANAAPPQWEGPEAVTANHVMTRTAGRLDTTSAKLEAGASALSDYVTHLDRALKPRHQHLTDRRATLVSEASGLSLRAGDVDAGEMVAEIMAHNARVDTFNTSVATWAERLDEAQQRLAHRLRNPFAAPEANDTVCKVADDGPSLSDVGHTILDVGGLLPVVGEPADFINGLWYTAEGDALNAGLSYGAMIPGLGLGATGTKWGGKAAAKGGDDVAETVTRKNVETPPDAPPTKHKRWERGDPIDALTAAGKEPAWTTVRQRYWKNEASLDDASFMWTPEQLERMNQGLAPKHRDIDVSYELNHIQPRRQPFNGGNNIENLEPLTPWDHAFKDPHRYYKGPVPEGWSWDTGRIEP